MNLDQGRSRLLLAQLLVVVLAPALSAQGRVWRVAPSGGDFTEIQPAVNAAQPGDTVLVSSQAGTYLPFFTSGKSLSILAADAGRPQIVGRCDLGPFPSGHFVRVAGLGFQARTTAPYTQPYAAYFSAGTAGTILIQDCVFESSYGIWSGVSPSLPGCALCVEELGTVILDGVQATSHDEATGVAITCREGVLTRCTIRGGEAHSCPTGFCTRISNGGGAVAAGRPNTVPSASIYISECDLFGGDVPLSSRGAQHGGDALFVTEFTTAFVFARNTVVAGGSSGSSAGAFGGNGMHPFDSTSVVYVDGNPFNGGTGAGTPGQPWIRTPPIPRALAAMWVAPPLVDRSQVATLSLLARPQETHVLFGGLGLLSTPIPGVPEPLLIFGSFTFFAGVLGTDGSGTATVPLAVPPDPNLLGLSLFFQNFGIATPLIIGPTVGVTIR